MCVATPESLELSSERLAKLPWEKSIAGDDVEMLFMPFIELQNRVMFDTQKNLKDLPFESELSFQSSSRKVLVNQSLVGVGLAIFAQAERSSS